jgi:hypothetical protein
VNAVVLSWNRSGGVRRPRSRTPNLSQQWRWLLYDEWRPVGNRIADPILLSRKEALTQEMAAFKDNVLQGAYRNLHPRIVLHPLMPWLAILLEETIRLVMSIIGTHVWEQQWPIVRWNNECCCNDAPYTLGGGYCREIVEGAQTGRRLRIHYNPGPTRAERVAARIT